MTEANEPSGSTATSAPGPATSGTVGAAPDAPARPAAPSTASTALLAALSVGWLAALLWSAQRSIAANGGTLAVASTALSLPVIISASLVCGAAVSLVVVNLLAHRVADRPAVRFASAIGAGLLTGVAAASTVSLGYADGGPAVRVLAGTIAAATVIGGAVGGLRAPVAGGMVTAALTVFAIGVTLSYFQSELTSLYGFGDTPQSQATALSRFSWTASLVGGLAAGLAAFGYLRRVIRRAGTGPTDPNPLRWPSYLLVGAGPGLFLVLAEVLIWTAGAQLLRLAGALSEADRAVQGMLGVSRVNHALVVLFLGGLTAMIAFGRTLRPAEHPDPRPEAGQPDPRPEAGQPDAQPEAGRVDTAGRSADGPDLDGPDPDGEPTLGPDSADRAAADGPGR